MAVRSSGSKKERGAKPELRQDRKSSKQRCAVQKGAATQYRELLKQETSLVTKAQSGGNYRVHLVYPNQYWVGMSNLGFQAVYSLFATTPGVDVDRAFLPEDELRGEGVSATGMRTVEQDRLLADCDCLAFSLSFETDYPHMVRMLMHQGLLSLDAEERAARADSARFGRPLLIVGGTAATLNPEPIADLVDIVVLGEAEELLAELTRALIAGKSAGVSRRELLRNLSRIQGIYVPSLYRVRYHADDTVAAFESVEAGPLAQPQRRYVKNLSEFPTHTRILSPATEFKSMFMTETGRGCEMGCRFCVAGYIYRPVRKRSEESIARTVELGMQVSESIGFVGAAVSSHKAIGRLASQVARAGKRASLSSLMAQKVSDTLAGSISESEYKTVALAPEAGSERLRRAVGKRVPNQTYIEAARKLASSGVKGFKLYFIVGLPTESAEDVDAIAAFSHAIRDVVVDSSKGSGTVGWVSISLNPFIPKAVTPFQWEPMMKLKEVERRVIRVRELIKGVPNLELRFEPPKESYFQALLSRGDRRVARILVKAEEGGQDWKWIVRLAEERILPDVPPAAFYVNRRPGFDELLPWDIVDPRVEKSLLKREALRAHGLEREDDALPDEALIERALTG